VAPHILEIVFSVLLIFVFVFVFGRNAAYFGKRK